MNEWFFPSEFPEPDNQEPRGEKLLSRITFAGSTLLLFLLGLFYFSGDSLSRLWMLIGKLHPVIVHFPIALLLLTAGVELLRLRSKIAEPSRVAFTSLSIGTLAAVAASVFGWVNAAGQEFSGSLEEVVFWHRWGGVGLTAFALCSFLLAVISSREKNFLWLNVYRGSVFASAALLGLSAHYGGLIVFGEEYFTEVLHADAAMIASVRNGDMRARYAGAVPVIAPPAGTKIDYERDIQPVLETHCYKCHANGKKKGDFQLDSRELVLRGGKTGPGAIPGKGSESFLVRLVVAEDPEEVMPNKGRRLNGKEIGLLSAWIDQGMPWGERKASKPEFTKADYRPRRVNLPIQDPERDVTTPVDRILGEHFKKHEIAFDRKIDDRRFIRKVFFDVLGVLPRREVLTSFLNDKAPDKRQRLIELVLSDRYRFDYAAHWLTFWNDALRNDYSGPGFLHGGRQQITYWLHGALTGNLPYDDFVAMLVAPKGGRTNGFVRGISWWKEGVVNANEEPGIQVAQNIGQVFMGANLKCASCHDGFTDAWTQNDVYGLANVYSQKRLEIHECNLPTGVTPEPGFLYKGLGDLNVRGKRARAARLAELLTSDENGRFARTIVNRMWHRFFGRGIVEPLDEMDNAPWNRDLLDWLASDLVEHDYNLKHTMRVLLSSRAYSMPAAPALERYPKDYVFKGPVMRRIQGEQLLDSIASYSGLWHLTTFDDIHRIFKILEKDPTDAQDEVLQFPAATRKDSEQELFKNEPAIIYTSGVLEAGSEPVEVDIDISGAETLWLGVTPRHRITQATIDSSVRRRRIQNAKIEEGTDKVAVDEVTVNSPIGIWGEPIVSGPGGVRSLSGTPWLRAVSSTPSGKIIRDVDQGGKALILGGEELKSGIGAKLYAPLGKRPFSAFGYDLRGSDYTRLRMRVGVENLIVRRKEKYEFIVIKNLPLRSSYLEANQLMFALGRPRREQVVTSRPAYATTLEGLEYMNSESFRDLLHRAGESLSKREWDSRQAMVDSVYLDLLQRRPSEKESTVIGEMLKSRSEGEGVRDLLWSMVLHPEFQLIG